MIATLKSSAADYEKPTPVEKIASVFELRKLIAGQSCVWLLAETLPPQGPGRHYMISKSLIDKWIQDINLTDSIDNHHLFDRGILRVNLSREEYFTIKDDHIATALFEKFVMIIVHAVIM